MEGAKAHEMVFINKGDCRVKRKVNFTLQKSISSGDSQTHSHSHSSVVSRVEDMGRVGPGAVLGTCVALCADYKDEVQYVIVS